MTQRPTASRSHNDLVIRIAPIPEIASVEKVWNALDEGGSHSFFVSWTWMGALLRSLPSLTEMRFLTFWCEDKIVGAAILGMKVAKLRGVIPIRQAWLNATGDSGFDCITIEHNSIASAPQWRDATWPALVNWFLANGRQLDELILPGVGNPPTTTGILTLDRREKGFRIALAGINPDSGLSPMLTRNSRQQLNRSIRFFEREGDLAVEAARDCDTALRYFEEMKILHTNSWRKRGKAGAFGEPFFETFCRELIVTGCAARTVDMLRISAGKTTLGYLFNLSRGGTIYNYQSGFDDANRAARPGYVCHALAIEHYAANQAKFYDFLAKPNRLKQSFGLETYELCWRQLRQQTLPFRAEHWMRRIVRQRPS